MKSEIVTKEFQTRELLLQTKNQIRTLHGEAIPITDSLSFQHLDPNQALETYRIFNPNTYTGIEVFKDFHDEHYLLTIIRDNNLIPRTAQMLLSALGLGLSASMFINGQDESGKTLAYFAGINLINLRYFRPTSFEAWFLTTEAWRKDSVLQQINGIKIDNLTVPLKDRVSAQTVEKYEFTRPVLAHGIVHPLDFPVIGEPHYQSLSIANNESVARFNKALVPNN